MAKPVLKQDNSKQVAAALKELARTKVLVGVPATRTDRKQAGGQITNAALSAIHNNGAPEVGIPARPFLIPGIRAVRAAIIEQFRIAGQKSLEGDQNGVMVAFTRAGLIAQNSVRKKITDGPFVPLKPATVKNRMKGRGTKSRRASEKKYLQLVGQGMDLARAQNVAGIRPLINTGQLRAAQTFVIRKV